MYKLKFILALSAQLCVHSNDHRLMEKNNFYLVIKLKAACFMELLLQSPPFKSKKKLTKQVNKLVISQIKEIYRGGNPTFEMCTSEKFT